MDEPETVDDPDEVEPTLQTDERFLYGSMDASIKY